MQWVWQHGLQVLNQMHNPEPPMENWTRLRSMDGSRVYTVFILRDMSGKHVKHWNNFKGGIRLDHRCVHCPTFALLAQGKEETRIEILETQIGRARNTQRVLVICENIFAKPNGGGFQWSGTCTICGGCSLWAMLDGRWTFQT